MIELSDYDITFVERNNIKSQALGLSCGVKFTSKGRRSLHIDIVCGWIFQLEGNKSSLGGTRKHLDQVVYTIRIQN